MVVSVEMKNEFPSIFRKVWGSIGGNGSDTERAQSIIRIFFISIAIAYVASRFISHDIPSEYGRIFLPFVGVSGVVSLFIFTAIIQWPGKYHSRRIFAMTHDYATLTLGMVLGGAALLPLYAILLWVTVGNGFRYGPRYLISSTGLALFSLGITAHVTPYWREQSYVTITLVVTTIIVPTYAFILLNRIHRARDAALEANLAKSRFLAQASHDLRQPIHAISLFIACLRDTALGLEEQKMVNNIDKSLQGLARLFRSLLDISTLDSGKIAPRKEIVAIGEVLEDVVRQNFEAARWAGVTLKLVVTKQYVCTDASLITTMVQNIISNALKYAPGGPVLIGCRRKRGKLSIEVYDRGNGIAEQHLPKVFEEFYQVRERGDKDIDGVGLGLSIVHRLSGLMGLDVSIKSTEKRGTAVTIDGLEMIPSQDSSPLPARPRSVALMKGLRVLLVEDDEDVLLATTKLLEQWGCTVQPEITVPKQSTTCDLIITDFDLGAKTTGSDCIEHIRRQSGRRIPAIVISGHDESKVREDLDDPEIPILTKPVRPAELRSTVMAQKLQAEKFSTR